jgi:dephospho-CoA kinase
MDISQTDVPTRNSSRDGDWGVTGDEYRGRVKRVALAGGIGAGKTAVSERLVALGWPVIDADVIARNVVKKGQPAWVALRDAFGAAVLTSRGDIDRKFLAEVVFHDVSALMRLNRITHGYIGAEIIRGLDDVDAEFVFVALPLYRPEHREIFHLDEVWAIEVDPTTALARLCAHRDFDEADARARLASQMSNEERARLADRVVRNEGTFEDLYKQVDAALVELGAA